jgi:hypothetical protein
VEAIPVSPRQINIADEMRSIEAEIKREQPDRPGDVDDDYLYQEAIRRRTLRYQLGVWLRRRFR